MSVLRSRVPEHWSCAWIDNAGGALQPVPPTGQLGLDDVALFIQVAAAGGVRAAARSSGESRSHLSRRLSALEERIGVRLVERDALRFALTDAGAAFLRRAQAILADLRDAEESARASSGRVRGKLRVDCSPLLAEVALEAIVRELVARHAEVSVDLHLATEKVDLRAQRVDIAFRTGPLRDDTGMRCRALATSLTAMFAAPAYLAAHGVPKEPRDLENHACIVVGPSREWQLRDAKVAVPDRLRFNGYAPAKRAVLAGAGIARFAAVYAEREVESGQLVPVLPAQSTSATVYAVIPGTGRIGPTVRALLDLAIVRITTERLCPPALRALLGSPLGSPHALA